MSGELLLTVGDSEGYVLSMLHAQNNIMSSNVTKALDKIFHVAFSMVVPTSDGWVEWNTCRPMSVSL